MKPHLPACLLSISLLSPLLAQAGEQRQTYRCDNDSQLQVSFSAAADGRPQATLHFADGDVVLEQLSAASGALYRNATISLHAKGDALLFEDERGNRRQCSKPASASSSFLTLGGSVTYLSRIALPADAILVVRVQNRAAGKVQTLSEQRYELAGAQVPIAFAATVDRDLIGRKSALVVRADIEYGGRIRFTSKPQPVSPSAQSNESLQLILKVAPARAR